MSLLVGTGAVYSIITGQPLKLESNNPELLEADEIDQRYLPPNPPSTIGQANDALRWDETSYMPCLGSGVLRYDTVRVPSNLPCEDEIVAAGCQEGGEIKWLLWGVFDGHAGWETAVALQDSMVNYIIRELAALSPSSKISDATGLNIDQAITNAFVSLDRDIMDLGAKAASGPSYLNDAMSQLGPAYSGSCALVSYYHSDSRVLKVACVGDSRAVLGRRNVSGGWDATALSADQTGNNPQEVARLQREHPDEPRMLKAGRVLGLAVSRAFGDSRWKWTRDLQEQAYRRFFGPRIVEPLLTPPYLTAEPIITTTKIEPGKGDFVIMASDGLWERLTNEQAVELVGRWLEKHDPSRRVPPPNLAAPPTAWSKKHVSTRKNPDPYMAYADRQSADETHFVVADENAATHLARNALGGGDEDKLCGLLTPSPPYSRNLRDDISVVVIFFGNEDPYSIQNFSDDSVQDF